MPALQVSFAFCHGLTLLLRYAIQANVTWHAGQEPGCLARGWFPLINVRSLGVLSQQVATEGRNENPVYTKWKVCWCSDVTDVTAFGPEGAKLANLCLFKVIGDLLLSTYGKSPWKNTIWGTCFVIFFQPPNRFGNRIKLYLEDHHRAGLGSPPVIIHRIRPFGRGPTTRSLGDLLTRLLTYLPLTSWDDPPSRWCKFKDVCVVCIIKDWWIIELIWRSYFWNARQKDTG